MIRKIKNLSDATLKKPGLIFSRDLLMFAYYTSGMAFVDIAHLTCDNIKGNYLVYKRRKTGQELQIRILPEIQELIDRYHSNSLFYFPYYERLILHIRIMKVHSGTKPAVEKYRQSGRY